MYNLFVTANVGAWDAGFYQYDKSRFLEYTSDSVSNVLSSLDEDQVRPRPAVAFIGALALEAAEGVDDGADPA